MHYILLPLKGCFTMFYYIFTKFITKYNVFYMNLYLIYTGTKSQLKTIDLKYLKTENTYPAIHILVPLLFMYVYTANK